jgi:hypothetical protein
VRTTAAETSGEGFGAQMAVPIVIGDEIEGLLFVDNRSPRPFTDLDESALVLLAEHAAVALRNARLFMEAQATGRRLQAVSRRLLEVQEAERRHLSRELHDEVGQALTAVKPPPRPPAASTRASGSWIGSSKVSASFPSICVLRCSTTSASPPLCAGT